MIRPLYFLVFAVFPVFGRSLQMYPACSWRSFFFRTLYFIVFSDFSEAGNAQTIVFPCV